MNKKQYIETFCANFLAAWTAQHYNDCCSSENYDKLQSPPIKNALYLAETTWYQLQELTKDTIFFS